MYNYTVGYTKVTLIQNMWFATLGRRIFYGITKTLMTVEFVATSYSMPSSLIVIVHIGVKPFVLLGLLFGLLLVEKAF